jgi:hypothetical protein
MWETADVECHRCGKCCKMPGTDEYCQYLEWEDVDFPIDKERGFMVRRAKCSIYNSRDGRLLEERAGGNVYCFPRMYLMDDIEGCAYQDHIDNIKRLIKNE